MGKMSCKSINNHFEFNLILKSHIIQEFMEEDGQILTPLVVAAKAGREKVVRMLLANYKMDLDKKCTLKFDGHMVHDASALWCAAGNGKSYFYLIKQINPCSS